MAAFSKILARCSQKKFATRTR